MVSIRKAKQGFQLRDRSKKAWMPTWATQWMQNPEEHKEKLGLLALGLTMGLLMVVLITSLGGETDSSNNTRVLEKLRPNHPHPHLSMHSKPLSDNMNALALDIIQTLKCHELFNKTSSGFGDFGGGGAGAGAGGPGDDEVEEQEEEEPFRRRRRLEEAVQHGDDGGFEMNEQEGGGGGAVMADDQPEEEEKWGDQVQGGAGAGGGFRGAAGDLADDFAGQREQQQGGFADDVYMGNGGGGGDWLDLNAQHLFCLAAMEEVPANYHPKDYGSFQCDVLDTKRQAILELWSAARAQIPQTDLLIKVLGLTTEQPNQALLGHSYNLWSPVGDTGMQYMLNTLNSENDADNGGLHGLQENLGEGKIFVDVGSCLGLTALAVHSKYPGTKIVSIEPASPNWLIQELNLRCNLDIHEEMTKYIKVVLAGVGPNNDDEDTLMAKLTWRPTATTSTRAWTPQAEHQPNDVELVVRLRKLKSLLAEADVYYHYQKNNKHKDSENDLPIDVLNMDCEGCEYNVIPAMTLEEFESIPAVLGAVHWGYIPAEKLPSSQRGKTTHERLCRHENIAKTTKECCAFPNLKVISSVPGEVLVDADNKGFPPEESTVSDVIQEGMCDDFDSWASEHFLNDVQEDWNWFELSSQAF